MNPNSINPKSSRPSTSEIKQGGTHLKKNTPDRTWKTINPHPTLPPGTPDWITLTLIEHTKNVWRPYSKTPLTTEEAVTIICNARRLIDTL